MAIPGQKKGSDGRNGYRRENGFPRHRGLGKRSRLDRLFLHVLDRLVDGVVGVFGGLFGLLRELMHAGVGVVDGLIEFFAGGLGLLLAGGERHGRGGRDEDGEGEEFFHDATPFNAG